MKPRFDSWGGYMTPTKKQQLVKDYAKHFWLRWADDVSEWSNEIGPVTLGGAYLNDGCMQHSPPCIYIDMNDQIIVAGPNMSKKVSAADIFEATFCNNPLHGV